ncbi:MAG: ROK family glucokinase [Candidatus Omnitrophica bacterium]|nr:ROK family glucokinase [Candidatus Omnitrophota bacterium]
MKKVAIGVDIGGTNIRLGIVGPDGKVHDRVSFLTAGLGRARLLSRLVRHISILRKLAAKKGWKTAGAGVGAPGPIDVERGFVYFFPNIPGWKDTPLKALLKKRLGMPVAVDNDANALALGEFFFGAGRGAKNIVVLTLGTGVGGGIILDGKLFHGHAYSAAEIGHLVINENGPRCGCGNRGCLETYVGNGYFVREAQRRLRAGQKSVLRQWTARAGQKLTPLLAARAARARDAFAVGLWRETAGHLASALAGLANVLNPERIVLGGGIAQNGAVLFGPLRAAFRKKAFSVATHSAKIVPAALGLDAGVAGAGALVYARQGRGD